MDCIDYYFAAVLSLNALVFEAAISKVHYQADFPFRDPKIIQHLADFVIADCGYRFAINDNFLLNQKIRLTISDSPFQIIDQE